MIDFTPSRLVLARKRRGVTKKELADRAGISTRILTSYESDEKRPSASTLARLAEVLDFQIGFFVGPDLEEPPIGASSFRALSNLTARRRDQALGSGALALALADLIANRFDLPKPNVPKLAGLDPETAADVVRREWHLGEKPIRNMIHLLEANGVRVFSLVEECAEVDAYSFWRDGIPYVFLNTQKSAEHSRMDAAHELGHLVMHWRHETPRGREVEHEANAFGSAFLMPRASVLAHAPRGVALLQLVKAKRRWKVSVAALIYRLHRLGLLSEWQYRSLFIEIGERGWRRSEPDSVDGETSQLLAKVFAQLKESGVSRGAIANELAITPKELNKLIFGLVMTGVRGEGDEPDLDGEGRPALRLV
jgi:Zn-dependent peptidase ImmA (M78 family)/DNA-binding XRE family transcriptional regulator